MHIGHVNLQVRDVDVSHDWYRRILDLHTYQHVRGVVAFMSANIESSHEVALMQVGADAPGQVPRQVGLNHVAWMVDTLDELKAMYHRLKENNVPIRAIVDHGLSIGIYMRDPDGNGVEVSYEQPRADWPRQHALFARDITNLGRFPGPWDDDPAFDRKSGVLSRFAQTLPQGTLPQGTLPQEALPQGTLPQGALPQGTLPHGAPAE